MTARLTAMFLVALATAFATPDVAESAEAEIKWQPTLASALAEAKLKQRPLLVVVDDPG